MPRKLVRYAELLGQVKQRIRQGQTRAFHSANAEMILTYWDIGRMILERQAREGWGASPILPQVIAKIHLCERKKFGSGNAIGVSYTARETVSHKHFMLSVPGVFPGPRG
jgi:hypothetical protein